MMLVAYIFQISIIIGTVKELMGEKQSIWSLFLSRCLKFGQFLLLQTLKLFHKFEIKIAERIQLMFKPPLPISFLLNIKQSSTKNPSNF